MGVCRKLFSVTAASLASELPSMANAVPGYGAPLGSSNTS